MFSDYEGHYLWSNSEVSLKKVSIFSDPMSPEDDSDVTLKSVTCTNIRIRLVEVCSQRAFLSRKQNGMHSLGSDGCSFENQFFNEGFDRHISHIDEMKSQLHARVILLVEQSIDLSHWVKIWTHI